MYTFVIIFAVVLTLSVWYFLSDSETTSPEVTPSESVSEEPVAVENPVVVVDNEVVDLKEAKKTAPKRPAKKTTAPPKAKQAKTNKK